LWKAKHWVILFASSFIAFHAVLLPFLDQNVYLVVSAVYRVNEKIGYGSLSTDDVSRSPNIVRKSDLGIKTCSVNAAYESHFTGRPLA